ncbi:MAG: hypothetical protein J7L45_01160 [Candidatus Aenigmarchaeota archaeon]|nr:hypothetical protein [Candidatus Aenigmarchaeota archaeon]
MKRYMDLLRRIPCGSKFAIPIGASGYLEIKKIEEKGCCIIRYQSTFYEMGKKVFEKCIKTSFASNFTFITLEDDNERISIEEYEKGPYELRFSKKLKRK